jgi:hypothetical protein
MGVAHLSRYLLAAQQNPMATDPTKVTPEEIAQYRQQLADYPEALDALDLIEENEGDLKQAASLLALESGATVSKAVPNILDEFAHKCRSVICDELFINELMTGVLSAGVGILASSGQIPAALATPVVIYLAKIGVRKWCESNK